MGGVHTHVVDALPVRLAVVVTGAEAAIVAATFARAIRDAVDAAHGVWIVFPWGGAVDAGWYTGARVAAGHIRWAFAVVARVAIVAAVLVVDVAWAPFADIVRVAIRHIGLDAA